MSNRGNLSSRPPDKGSFPLDHFHECDKEAKSYSQCVIKHELMPKRCRQFQVNYLQCRMNAGLMEKEDMEKLGINPETSWDTEEQEQKFLFDKIQRMKQKAWNISMNKSYQEYQQKQATKTEEKNQST